jgi:hypothetical protein
VVAVRDSGLGFHHSEAVSLHKDTTVISGQNPVGF